MSTHSLNENKTKQNKTKLTLHLLQYIRPITVWYRPVSWDTSYMRKTNKKLLQDTPTASKVATGK